MRHLELTSGWQLRQRNPSQALELDRDAAEGWYHATVPGTVHEALMAADRLQDPFIGMNEEGAQWIGESDWIYRCSFQVPEDLLDASAVVLACDGLDTIATIWLNGAQVLVSDNMFVPHRVEVQSLLRIGENEIHILFQSPVRIGREREAVHGATAVWNGEASRVYVRKAQYHYGWDWGPTLVTSGPWQPIRLEAYDARIADINCPVDIAADLQQATLPVVVTIEDRGGVALPLGAQHAGHRLIVNLALNAPDGRLVSATSVAVEESRAEHTFTVESPELWWPNGYGAPARYSLSVELVRAQEQLDQSQIKLGLRRLELVQEPLTDAPGTSFLFQVNNTPIFCGGANWIPADSFTTRVSAARYRMLIEQAADANMVMLRIWGGGIYEDAAFYEACDDLGIMVWQDFMFACGIYPAADWFLASVRAEAEAQLRRLRHHPSIVLWCGNNEDYQIAYSLGRYDHTAAPDATSSFPARVIYEQLLAEICAALDPTRPYRPGSPFSGANPDDPTIGDRHTWEVWGRGAADYHTYPELGGRFVSEFGMAAMPTIETIEAFAPPEERYPGSRTLEYHNKATGGTRRIAAYLSDNLRPVATLDEQIYATQLIQAEALAVAYRGWRRGWGGPGRYAIAGVLVWQINDCWPVTSWSIIDYYLRPKAAYYVVRRELAPLTIGMGHGPDGDGVQAWLVNGTTEAIDGRLELRTWTVNGELVGTERAEVTLPPNQTLELGQYGLGAGGEVVLDARLIVGERVAARAALWTEPYKYLHLPDPMIIMDLEGQETIRLRAIRPAKGVLLSAGDGVEWSDNMLDLMPDDEIVIKAHGLGDRPVQIRWLQ
jgi:beta-mannosidase